MSFTGPDPTAGLPGYTPTATPPGSSTAQPINVPPGYQPPTFEPGGSLLTGIDPAEYASMFTGPPAPNHSQITSLGGNVSKHTYVEGDQWGPVHEPTAQVLALQQQLIAAGFLDPSTYHKGVWDINSADAYKMVLGIANTYGASAPDMLSSLVANPVAKPKGYKAPLSMTNPADIAAAVSGGGPGQTNAARSLLGQDLPASETQSFVKWYQDQETQARDAYNRLDLNTGTSYTGAPGLDAAAQAYIKQNNLGQAVAYGTASRMLTFFSMLNGVSGI